MKEPFEKEELQYSKKKEKNKRNVWQNFGKILILNYYYYYVYFRPSPSSLSTFLNRTKATS